MSAMNRLSLEIIDRCAPRENDARANHGAAADDSAFVDPAIPADNDVVFDYDRRGVHGLEDSAKLRRRAQVDPLADLGTGADQSVRVDHRTRAHVRSDIYVHGRHAHDSARNVGAASDARPTRHDSNAVGQEP